MPKLIVRGAFVRFIDVRLDKGSKVVYTKINMTADFSAPVRDLMEWGEPPIGYGSANLDGELHATHFILTPNSRQLKENEIQMSAMTLGGFQFHRVKSGEGGTSQELRFQIVSTQPEAPALIANYLRIIGESAAQLRVNYEQQSELPLNGENAEEEDSERLISEEQADETADESGAQTLAQMPRRNRRKLEPAVQ